MTDSGFSVDEAHWLRALLPPEVIVIEGRLSDARGELFEIESGALANAVPKRRNEFAAGRFMAHAAMVRLRGQAQAVPMGPDRAPQWPAGVVGSITHAGEFGAAAVARSEDWASLGVDLDVVSRFDPSLDRLVLTPRERQLGLWLPLVFSAKESVYKAQYPLARQWLDFADLELTVEPGRFEARLRRAAGPFAAGHVFAGRWREAAGLVVTAVLCPPQAERIACA